jgi:hypothetical protein
VRILFDHCVPDPLRFELASHSIRTTAELGWEHLKNGQLLSEARLQFDVFLTVDKNIRYQQNLRTLPLAVIVLNSVRTTPDALAPFAPVIERALAAIRPCQMVVIDSLGNISSTASKPP